ncbi:MAG: DUF1552 domain-containing protein [Myxococcota bacterium]
MLIISSRRNFLRGLGVGAGAMLLTPMARMLVSEAMGQEASEDKRFLLYNNFNGIVEGAGHPQMGADETDFDLGAYETTLGSHREDITWVTNLYNPHNYDLHGNVWHLTVMPTVGDDLPGGPSIDRVIAQEIGAGMPFSSLTLQPIKYKKGGDDFSADGASNPIATPYNEPVTTFAEVFGMAAGEDPQLAAERLAKDMSVLDSLTGDISRMQSRLAGPERQKMEQYLDSLRGLEQRLQNLAAISCDNLGAPDPSLGDYPAPGRSNPDSVPPEAPQAMIDIGVHALACGLTRVVVLQWNDGVGFLGDGVGSHNDTWHGGTPERFRLYHEYHGGNLARIWEMLQQFETGAGSVADSSLVMWTSRNGSGHHRHYHRLQAMLLGNAGGAFTSGRFISLPQLDRSDVEDKNYGALAGGFATSDLYVSVANALGAPIDSFGDPMICKGPLPALA